MADLVNPKESEGDRFARNTYNMFVRLLKIDPIVEGVLMERKVKSILNPDNITAMADETYRDKALIRANNITDNYINRSRKFWKAYQLYCYNTGELKAVRDLYFLVSGSRKEASRLLTEQKDILS